MNVAQKAIAMFRSLNAPILGVIENMSDYVCPHCGVHDEVFGVGGAARMAERLGVALLGAIPLTTEIRRASDAGRPVVVSAPESAWPAPSLPRPSGSTSLANARPEGESARPQVTF